MSIVIYTEVVLSINPDGFLIKCGRCGGTGENNREYECRVCNGAGKVLLKVPADLAGKDVGVVRCGRCNGTGDNNREHFCRVCDGAGALVGPFPRVICSRCDGTGDNSQQHFCSSCDACGSIYIGDIKSY